VRHELRGEGLSGFTVRWFAIVAFMILLGACSRDSPDASQPGPVAVLLVEQEVTDFTPPAAVLVAAGRLDGRRICLDPGHDQYWTPGATARDRTGRVPKHPATGMELHEHELTLDLAYWTKLLLEEEGASVCVTRRPREEGGGLYIEPYDFTGDGLVRALAIEDVPEQMQPRIDWANLFGAEILVSLHFNGSGDPRMRGTEVYYSKGSPREIEGYALASALLKAMLSTLEEVGYPSISRGVLSDAYQRYPSETVRRLLSNNAAAIRSKGLDPASCLDCARLVTLGNNPMSLTNGAFVAALVEVEFLSNPDVVESLTLRPDLFDLLARALRDGLIEFFGRSVSVR
jgi:N-acetylmuramoyl-L-alanine amidase